MKRSSPTYVFGLASLLSFLLAAGCGKRAPEQPEEEPAHADKIEHDVHVAPEALARNNIETEKVTLGALGGGTEVPAEVEAHPDRIARVGVLVPGRVSQASVVVGQRVKKGQALAVVESAEIASAQSDIAQAQATLDAARGTWQRQRDLEASGIGAKREMQEADASLRRAEAALSAANGRVRVYGGGGRGGSTTLKSPIDGEVLERHATVGETITPDDKVFVVGDLSVVWVTGRLSEQDVAAAKAGAAAELTLPAYPGKSFPGKLDYVAPMLDEKTRTLTVRMELQNTDGMLRPGLFGKLRLVGDVGEGAAQKPVVPEEAVQRTPSGDVVFVAGDTPGEFHVVPVAIGTRRSGRAEVLAGLDGAGVSGLDLVVRGAFILKSELLKSQMAADED